MGTENQQCEDEKTCTNCYELPDKTYVEAATPEQRKAWYLARGVKQPSSETPSPENSPRDVWFDPEIEGNGSSNGHRSRTPSPTGQGSRTPPPRGAIPGPLNSDLPAGAPATMPASSWGLGDFNPLGGMLGGFNSPF